MIYTQQEFWTATLERAIKSAGQGAVLGWGAGTFTAVGEVVTAAQAVGYAALGMFVLSVFTSVGSAQLGSNEGPSLVGEELVPRPPAGDDDEDAVDLPEGGLADVVDADD